MFYNNSEVLEKLLFQIVAKAENGIFVPPTPEEILDIRRRLNLTNPGYLGKEVVLPEDLPADIQVKVNESYDKFKFNEFLSQIIPLDRELKELRGEICLKATYSNNLPKTSVIIAFYNEPFSMIMRTIYSILKRAPLELIEEILLIDDCSDDEEILKALHEVVPKLPKVRIIRSPTRLGLMKARVLGADSAIGPILTVIDSHVEFGNGWLPPLLDPFTKKSNIIILPGVEVLNPDTLKYNHVIFDEYTWVGGFTWELMYTWTNIKRNKEDMISPVPSPTMLGAAFVIRKDYFESLGHYDEGFELWGGENLELSFKVWMCGGEMYQAFCSHVGHMFRARPYWNDEADMKKIRNTDRLAEVWLDDYKKYYHQQTKFNNRTFGDITKQLDLKKKLGCKSFQWYVDNVYPGVYTLNF
ncbi:CLUMA_CG001081, isoform A [Clunio marinus]|uniref:CLUMA_CG001081, isoform A n=1 Tax=Clunio marinus TaxID=568069 RepID=A0A1J1HGY9_9DIPT|nr:CLUMA_CG001081, isoform A [Clunio marinus]